MAILRDRKDYQLLCDQCQCETDVFDDFDEMISEAKRSGWKIIPSPDRFTHTCPDCAGQGRLARQRELFGK